MIPDVELARISAATYDAGAAWAASWELDGTRMFLKGLDDLHVIAFRGSMAPEDWMRDAEAFPLWDPRIGFVHAGFMAGMNDALDAVRSLADDAAVVVTGHSLGGARARILAALLAHEERPVARCAVFGSPRPGFANLARVLQKSGTPLASYRNRNDPVPLVPCLGDLYVHPDAWAAVDDAPDAFDLDPLRDHRVARYVAALAAAAPPAASPPQALPAGVTS